MEDIDPKYNQTPEMKDLTPAQRKSVRLVAEANVKKNSLVELGGRLYLPTAPEETEEIIKARLLVDEFCLDWPVFKEVRRILQKQSRRLE